MFSVSASLCRRSQPGADRTRRPDMAPAPILPRFQGAQQRPPARRCSALPRRLSPPCSSFLPRPLARGQGSQRPRRGRFARCGGGSAVTRWPRAVCAAALSCAVLGLLGACNEACAAPLRRRPRKMGFPGRLAVLPKLVGAGAGWGSSCCWQWLGRPRAGSPLPGWAAAARRSAPQCRAASCRALGEYEKVFRSSVAEPEKVWGAAAEQIQWYKPWTRALERGGPGSASW